MRQRDDNHEPPEWVEVIPAGKDRDIQIFPSELCFKSEVAKYTHSLLK